MKWEAWQGTCVCMCERATVKCLRENLLLSMWQSLVVIGYWNFQQDLHHHIITVKQPACRVLRWNTGSGSCVCVCVCMCVRESEIASQSMWWESGTAVLLWGNLLSKLQPVLPAKSIAILYQKSWQNPDSASVDCSDSRWVVVTLQISQLVASLHHGYLNLCFFFFFFFAVQQTTVVLPGFIMTDSVKVAKTVCEKLCLIYCHRNGF